MYRRNKLLEDRKEKLEDAGFVWDCNAMRDDEAFHENYEKLLAFKKARGEVTLWWLLFISSPVHTRS